MTAGRRRGARRGHQRVSGEAEHVGGQIDEHAAGGRDVAQVGEQAVARVDHGGSPEIGGLGTRVVRRRRPQLRGDQGILTQAGRQQSQAGRGAAERAGYRDHVAGGRA